MRKRTIKEINQSKEKLYNVYKTSSLTVKEELDFMLKTIKKNRSKINVAVELGSYIGGTSVYIIDALKKTAKLYCVDSFVLNRKDVRPIFVNDVLPNFKTMVLLEKTTHNASQDFSKGQIDFLFIDADHQDHSIRQDCADWLPKVRSGGIVAFHDYGHSHFVHVKTRVNEATPNWKLLGVEGHLAIKIKP